VKRYKPIEKWSAAQKKRLYEIVDRLVEDGGVLRTEICSGGWPSWVKLDIGKVHVRTDTNSFYQYEKKHRKQ
jgi:hypothetical protein